MGSQNDGPKTFDNVVANTILTNPVVFGFTCWRLFLALYNILAQFTVWVGKQFRKLSHQIGENYLNIIQLEQKDVTIQKMRQHNSHLRIKIICPQWPFPMSQALYWWHQCSMYGISIWYQYLKTIKIESQDSRMYRSKRVLRI